MRRVAADIGRSRLNLVIEQIKRLKGFIGDSNAGGTYSALNYIVPSTYSPLFCGPACSKSDPNTLRTHLSGLYNALVYQTILDQCNVGFPHECPPG
jgi:hypothetical protein